MKKKYVLLNSIDEVEGPNELFDYIDLNIIEFPLYTKNVREYRVTYEENSRLYSDIVNDLEKMEGKKTRIFDNEYVLKIKNEDVIFLVDDTSVIVHMDNKFAIYGRTSESKSKVVSLIREAIYEGYVLDNDLLLNSAAFSTNHEQGNVLVGPKGTGKTALLIENLMRLPATYISNSIVGVHNNRIMASTFPVSISHGVLSHCNGKEYDDLNEKETYSLKHFIEYYSLSTDSNVRVKNLIFPHFSLDSHFEIEKIDKKDAHDALIKQVLNYGDKVRPYLWVNEVTRNLVKKKIIDSKINGLIGSTESFHVSFGPNINEDNIKTMRKVMKI